MDSFISELDVMQPRTSWSRRGFVMTSLVSGFALSMRPVSAQTVITTDTSGLTAGEVKIPVKGGEMPAYQAMPDKGGPFPTVLVIHEAWGVHEHIRDICRRLAKAGYFAIAGELWARQGNAGAAKDIDETRKIMTSVPTDQVMSDLDATVAYAKGTGKADTAKLAVTGFCWGGFATWMYAAHNPGLKAAVAWYGSDRAKSDITPKNPLDIAGEVKCPVLALYGGQDQSIPKETIDKREQACKAAGKTCEVKIFADAPHGFNADYRPSYRADAAKDGWSQMLAWFKKNGVA
jgi:carboxymethylenebutenolidase